MYYLIVLGVFVIWGLGLVVLHMKTVRDADAIRESRIRHGLLPETINAETFKSAYVRTAPLRGHIYGYFAALAAAVFTPLIVNFTAWVWQLVWRAVGRPDAFTEGEMIHSFGLALAVMAWLFLVAGISMWLFHKRHPGNWEDQLKQSTAAV